MIEEINPPLVPPYEKVDKGRRLFLFLPPSSMIGMSAKQTDLEKFFPCKTRYR